MSQQESQFVENLVPWSNSSSNKAPDTLDATYIDTLYDHDIVMNLLGRKIPKELTPLKERILQKRSSPQLDDQAVFAIMNATKELAYNLEGPTNKILRTPMFPLEYDGLIKGENTQWNIVAMPNNSQCDNKLSTPKLDAYLVYSRDSKSPWTVKQNNVVNHPRVRSYSQLAKRNTFSSLSLKLKAKFAGEVLTTTKAQTAGSESHFVNSILWLLEKAKAIGLIEVDLMRDIVSFSIVSSHKPVIAYLHWLDPKEKHFYMSYLRSYSTFEANDIRECNNTIKNIIDNAKGPRKIKIGEALVTLEPIKGSWNSQSTAINPPTPNTSFFGDSRPRKVLEDVRMKRPHWRTFIDGVKSSLDLTSLHMNLLFDYDNIYRLEDGSKVYIEGENNIDNFLHSKGPHPFPDTATAFCTKGLDEIFGVFRNGLPEDYDQPREAQQCYELYF
jgi:hypothetical protein